MNSILRIKKGKLNLPIGGFTCSDKQVIFSTFLKSSRAHKFIVVKFFYIYRVNKF